MQGHLNFYRKFKVQTNLKKAIYSLPVALTLSSDKYLLSTSGLFPVQTSTSEGPVFWTNIGPTAWLHLLIVGWHCIGSIDSLSSSRQSRHALWRMAGRFMSPYRFYFHCVLHQPRWGADVWQCVYVGNKSSHTTKRKRRDEATGCHVGLLWEGGLWYTVSPSAQ